MITMRRTQNRYLKIGRPLRRNGAFIALALIGALPLALAATSAVKAQTAAPSPGATSPAPASPPPAAAPADFSKVEIKTTNLGHNLYMLEGQGGNITVSVARDAVLMVDGEFAPLHDKILAAIRAVSNKPIRYLVNTHFHGDHTGGNAAFAKDGTEVVAQENVKKRLASGTTNGLTGNKTPPADPALLPSKTYDRALNLRFGGSRAQLYHVNNAHTDGDTYVWFKDANVLATGDTVTMARYPNFDFANGGNIKGVIDSANLYLGLVNDKTHIVPGHGPLATKADLVIFRDMIVTARDRMAALIKAGKTESDVVAARPFADFDAKLAANDQAATSFIRVVYHSLADGKAR